MKLIINQKVIKIVIIFSIISNSIVLFKNYKYENLYKNLDGNEITISGVVIQKNEKKHKIKIEKGKYKNTYLYVYLKSNIKVELECGDKVKIEGIFFKPKKRTNYYGFDYGSYLKTVKVYGSINAKKITLDGKNQINIFLKVTNKLKQNIQSKIEKLEISSEKKQLLNAILIGNKEQLDDEIIQDFSKANISHILAISGLHISYIILFSTFVFNKLIGKHYSKLLTSIAIFIYMNITGLEPSAIRAGVTGIIMVMSNFFYRKNDTWENLGLSLLILLIINPYNIQDIGLQLSYLGVIRYYCFPKRIKKSI